MGMISQVTGFISRSASRKHIFTEVLLFQHVLRISRIHSGYPGRSLIQYLKGKSPGQYSELYAGKIVCRAKFILVYNRKLSIPFLFYSCTDGRPDKKYDQ